MFDFIRNRGSTAEEKRLEALGAYLDNALTADERERFEDRLSRDKDLRNEMEQLRALKMQLHAMPRRHVPRSFALDPALYGRPKAQPMMQLYPVLRGATALTAFLLIFTLALGAFGGQFAGGSDTAQIAAEVALEDTAMEESAPVEVEEAVTLMTEAPASGGAVEDRIKPTVAASAELVAPESITADSPASPLPAEGYLDLSGVPPAGIEVQATVEPPAGDIAEYSFMTEEPETSITMMTEPGEAEDGDTAADIPANLMQTTTLRLIQIGLAVAFLLLLILWLIARRRVRTL